ncbi:MAG TPA: cellulase family glycosylhydrolase [Candidatus Saccharimonadales bacterium]|nr:cellulase family glycosylhydrolase [Candidatus Saccharimonadales bacterium]
MIKFIRFNYYLFALTCLMLACYVASPAPPALAAVNGALKVVSNHVLTTDGKIYVPEGISVYGGLEDANYMENLANDNAQIIAAAKYWHANTIRLQVAEGNLFTIHTRGKSYNNEFLQTLIKQVNLAHSHGMAVVINDQTEFTSRISGPTIETSKFWKIISNTFKNQPFVIFDLFNEPNYKKVIKSDVQPTGFTIYRIFGVAGKTVRQHHKSQISSNKIWNIWENGGRLNGISYLGMQTLVNQIRSYDVNNIIWIEGPNQARYLPNSSQLINGSNIVYSIHHPNLNNPVSWDAIGNLSSIAPVVDGEWAQYESTRPECYSLAYTNAPLYLNYLHQHNVGVIAWSLQANSLLQGNRFAAPTNTNIPNDPTDATALKKPNKIFSSYSCSNIYGQGVGQLIQSYFEQNSVNFSSL